MRTITSVLAAFFFILIGCAHSEKNSAEFEGMHGKNKIRVFVQVQADMTDPHCEDGKCRQMIVQSARERCIILLPAMVQYKSNYKSTISKRGNVADTVYSPEIKKITCNGLLCGGLVDFKVDDSILGKIRNAEVNSINDDGAAEKPDVRKDD